MDRGLDYSWGRPDIAQAWAAGYRFVSRYLSWLPNGKCIDAAELAALRTAGFHVALNWEFQAGDARGGAAKGTEQATEAVRQARALGYPTGATIYHSVDFDATAAELSGAVTDYFRAVATVLRAGGYRVGAYGGYRTIKYLFDNSLIDDGWQTYAWSSGQWDSRAAMRQVRNGQTVAGADVDLNERYGTTHLMGQSTEETPAPVATERTLTHEINKQDNGYYCGPASTRTALSVRGITVAESTLATKLHTTTAGTDSSNDIVRVLNEYVGDVYRAVFIPGQTASQAEQDKFKSDLVRSIDAGFAVVANVVGTGRDVNGGAYTYSGGHYVAVAGYRDSGDQALVSDVAIGKDYWMTSKALAIWIAARGYAYAGNAPTAPAPSQPATIAPGAPFPLPAGHYYGDLAGPNESHGGYYASEQPTIKAIQRRLIEVGAVPGISDPNSTWADGLFEQQTIDAVKRFQTANGLVADGKVGPLTWAALFPAVPAPTPAPQPEPEPVPEPAPEPEPAPVDTAAIVAAVLAQLRVELAAEADAAVARALGAATFRVVVNG